MQIGHHRRTRAIVHTAAAEREGGYVLVMFALLLIPLLLLVGLSVDVGSWYNRASDMQKAADAASLAGVVWLPDEAKAREVAIETAAKNGFDNEHPDIEVLVNRSATVANRLQVTIRDRRVGSFVYSAVGGNDLDMRRVSYAEYVTPVPMGSPRNYFGTGQMLSGDARENLWVSTNTYCASKANGDRHQSAFDSGPDAGFDVRGSCTNTPANADYRAQGYELYIDAVSDRPSDIELRLLDPQFNTDPRTLPGVQTGENCVTTYSYTWPTGNTGWQIQNVTRYSLTGPLQVQTRNSNTSTTWSSTTTIQYGAVRNQTYTANRYRTRAPLTTTPNTVCTPIMSPDRTFAAMDRRYNGSAQETYTVQLFQADNTPLNDADNPLICEQNVTRDTAYDDYEYLGSARWMTLRTNNSMTSECRITTSMPDGRYIFRMRNVGSAATSSSSRADGENNWGIVARYTNATGNGTCDGRTDTLCPRVYGKDAISVRALSSASSSDFFLAEIAPAHAGKRLRIELWDPGEGGRTLEILRPTGTDEWVPHPFNWSEPYRGSDDGVMSLDVTSGTGSSRVDLFNARLLTITVDLTGYAPPTDNNWWKIRYTFSGSSVNDRTTWSARILGDPVHLVEE